MQQGKLFAPLVNEGCLSSQEYCDHLPLYFNIDFQLGIIHDIKIIKNMNIGKMTLFI